MTANEWINMRTSNDAMHCGYLFYTDLCLKKKKKPLSQVKFEQSMLRLRIDYNFQLIKIIDQYFNLCFVLDKNNKVIKVGHAN